MDSYYNYFCIFLNLSYHQIFSIINKYISPETQASKPVHFLETILNPLNPKLNPICCLLALLGAHNFLHVSRIRVKSYIWSTYS